MSVRSFTNGYRGIAALCVVSLHTGLAAAQGEQPLQVAGVPPETSDVEPRVQRYPSGDGVYGRFAGDLDLGAEAGASYDGNWNAAVGVQAWYFWTAGLSVFHSQAASDRVGYPKGQTAISVEIRPLFIPRYSQDMEQGPPRLDLLLDSLSLGMGVYFNHGAGAGVERRGLQASLALGLPLLADTRGPWIELAGIHRVAESESNSNAVLLTLSWHWLLSTGLNKR